MHNIGLLYETIISSMQEGYAYPKALSAELHNIGFQGIWMLDRGINVEKGHDVYDSKIEMDV